jgi:acyl-coenzyme A thioesterase PaaI-like protein
MSRSSLDLWRTLSAKPGGKWLFSRLVCFKAPYFASISPSFERLEQGRCDVRIRKRRSVLNHIGTVHAIAMCNMAELAGGTMTEVSVPSTHRWIPKGMTVNYLKKASTDLLAIATPETTQDWSTPGERKVKVVVTDRSGEAVFDASITMWISARR